MLVDCAYYANGEFDASARNRNRTAVDHNKMDTVTDLLQIFMIGKAVQSAEDQAVFVNNLAAYFRREPHLLQCILRDTIESDPRMRNVFFSVLVDNQKLQKTIARQNLSLKFGGQISDRRWKLQFSPCLQTTVE